MDQRKLKKDNLTKVGNAMKVLTILFACLLFLSPAFCNGEIETDPAAENAGVHPARFLGQVKPVLYVADVRTAAAFYRDVLGFQFLGFAGKEDAPYYAEMAAGDQKFGLHEPQNDRDRERVGKQKLYFRVNHVEPHRAWVISKGTDASEIKHTDWMDMFTVRDTDGHDIVFAETDPAVHKTNPW